MKLHIGKEIKKKAQEKGWNIQVFSEKLNMPYRTAQYLFGREDIGLAQLIEIGEALDFDFLTLFKTQKVKDNEFNEHSAEYKVMPEGWITLTLTLQIAGKEANFAEFPKLLKATREYAKGLGFKLI